MTRPANEEEKKIAEQSLAPKPDECGECYGQNGKHRMSCSRAKGDRMTVPVSMLPKLEPAPPKMGWDVAAEIHDEADTFPAPKPANQCDGCARGELLKGGYHYLPDWPSWHGPSQRCTKEPRR